ncbi:hypothetical protein PG2012B_0082 [Bifidobacterium pseudolongum subsp. globosum]|nr:hypothetical protein PG2012B_0082 [Bifidobacterium pseudolongum subsp. globosum]
MNEVVEAQLKPRLHHFIGIHLLVYRMEIQEMVGLVPVVRVTV